MNSTATTWPATWWRPCRGCKRSGPIFSRCFATSSWNTRSTSVSSAKTCPKFGTGSGRTRESRSESPRCFRPPKSTMKILVLNSGSSSEKCCVYEITDKLSALAPQPLWEAQIEWSGSAPGGAGRANLEVTDSSGAVRKESRPMESRRQALEHLLNSWREGPTPAVHSFSEIGVVGHRIVHGGGKLVQPVIVTPAVKNTIRELAAFAPLHNKAELEGIEVVEKVLGTVPQVAVFDTAFHHHLPQAAAVYPGPYRW